MAPFKSSKSRNIGQQLGMWTTSNFGDVLKNPAAVEPEPMEEHVDQPTMEQPEEVVEEVKESTDVAETEKD